MSHGVYDSIVRKDKLRLAARERERDKEEGKVYISRTLQSVINVVLELEDFRRGDNG